MFASVAFLALDPKGNPGAACTVGTDFKYAVGRGNKVDLLKDSSLVAVYADDVFVTAVLEEKNGLVGTSRLMIMFNAKDMQLKQWTVTDPQGYDTTVAVYNLDSTRKVDPGLFKIDFTNYALPPG